MIHPTALISADVTLADDVTVGPFCILEGDITIGAGSVLKAHVHILGTVTIGEKNTFHSFSVIGDYPQDLGYTPEIQSGVRIGNGNSIREHATIHRGSVEGGVTTLGNDSFLMAGSHIGHDSKVGNNTILANNALLGGFTEVGDRVFLGGGAGVHQFVKIGSYAMIQGNSGLTKDLPPYCVSHGINLMSGLNVIGLRRAGFTAEQRKEIKSLFFLLFQSGNNLSVAIQEAEELSWSPPVQLMLDAVMNPSRKGCMTR